MEPQIGGRYRQVVFNSGLTVFVSLEKKISLKTAYLLKGYTSKTINIAVYLFLFLFGSQINKKFSF
jgi:hypothetical protein